MNVHHKCQRKVANLCGVNQKLMAEALAMIETQQVGRNTHYDPNMLYSETSVTPFSFTVVRISANVIQSF